MPLEAARSFAGVCLAILAGTVGMGLVYDAVVSGNGHQLTIGVPMLLVGLWWSGRELGRSTLAQRDRKARMVAGAGRIDDEGAAVIMETE